MHLDAAALTTAQSTSQLEKTKKIHCLSANDGFSVREMVIVPSSSRFR